MGYFSACMLNTLCQVHLKRGGAGGERMELSLLNDVAIESRTADGKASHTRSTLTLRNPAKGEAASGAMIYLSALCFLTSVHAGGHVHRL